MKNALITGASRGLGLALPASLLKTDGVSFLTGAAK